MKNGETIDSVISIDKMQNISWRRRKDARPPEIIEATKKILEDNSKKEKMRIAARTEAEKWDWNQATLQLKNYYTKTLNEI